MSAQMNAIWDRLDPLLTTAAPGISESLRKPATEAQVDAVEAHTGCKFPDDVRAAYLRHDGQHWGMTRKYPFLGSYYWSPLDNLLRRWDLSMSILRDSMKDPEWAANFVQAEDGLDDTQTVRDDYWNPLWLPFGDGGSQGLFLDLAPGPAGQVGQIAEWDNVELARQRIVATSVSAYFQSLIEAVESGQIVFAEVQNWGGWTFKQSGASVNTSWDCAAY